MSAKDPQRLSTYVVAFVLSLVLTLGAFYVIASQLLTGWSAIVVIVLAAIVQFVVQVTFFLHLGREAHPRWNVITLGFMLAVLLIVVFGSLWIMANLDYHYDDMNDDAMIMQDKGASQQ